MTNRGSNYQKRNKKSTQYKVQSPLRENRTQFCKGVVWWESHPDIKGLMDWRSMGVLAGAQDNHHSSYETWPSSQKLDDIKL